MFIRPSEGKITSRFGETRKNNAIKVHKGVDIGSDGSPAIKAAASGVVTRAKVIGGYGNTITIAHTLNGKKYETLYAHLKSISVKVGQSVKQGEQIGIKGTTGNSTGIHLHFEIHKPSYEAGQPNAVNPLYYISEISVSEVQKLLNTVGYKLVIDGIEGPLTIAAIKDFQKNNSLIVDGIVGPKTLAALKKK
ncbi:peptidoglycan DD-metalloendopeptidase family protein [Psychrobacillus sp. FSL K6-2836]|uniref:peptidoglycan DD-metalloendopeptidase family protein n=1 Tax=Psychrobacillus sp. FSL K6-2836 TaxID=2921548 RepID=UPI0030F7AF8A